MSIISPRATLRWKDWIPLITQQQRLRNLLQISAYNVDPYEKCNHLERGKEKHFYYYTLHLTTMSAPFYTSKKLESDNPKWEDIDINQIIGSAKGVVIRVWWHRNDDIERVITVWGVYFSGLYYLGPRLISADPKLFNKNTIVFHMKGGYYTSLYSLRAAPTTPHQRVEAVGMAPGDVRPSYSVSLLLRLHSIQQAIKQHSVAVASLRERISEGDFSGGGADQKESVMLRRLLRRTVPSPHPRLHQQKIALKKETEDEQFCVHLLTQERDKRRLLLRQRTLDNVRLSEENQDKNIELMDKYRNLQKDVQSVKELKRCCIDAKENLFSVNTVLQALRRKRIAELNIIYPISQITDDKFAIGSVHLPNSEDFGGQDEVMISVSLGFVAHLVQMIAYFLNVPLRYSIVFAGSRSRIVDHIIEDIPENEREFPLYSTGKDKLQFNYAVYLLNKNIAQLRWYCNITTSDLRTTLHNLLALLNLKPSHSVAGLEACKRTLSTSTLYIQEGPCSRLRVPQSTMSHSLDMGLDQIDGQRPQPVPRVRSITHSSTRTQPILRSSEYEAQQKFLQSWVSKSLASNNSYTEVDSEKSLHSNNEPARHSPAPEESLASIINKMNSPPVQNPRRQVDGKLPTRQNNESEGEDSGNSLLQQSIRQVTTRHTILDS